MQFRAVVSRMQRLRVVVVEGGRRKGELYLVKFS
jgi:hypothetical protein